MSASTTLTFESTLTQIQQAHPHSACHDKKDRKKTKDKDTVCSLCYLRLIQRIDIYEIKQIYFKYRSIRPHYIKIHPKYKDIKPKSKNLFYFPIDNTTHKVISNCQDVNVILQTMNDLLPPDTNTTDNAAEEDGTVQIEQANENPSIRHDIEPPPSNQMEPTNITNATMDKDEKDMKSEEAQESSNVYQSTLTSLQPSLSNENYVCHPNSLHSIESDSLHSIESDSLHSIESDSLHCVY